MRDRGGMVEYPDIERDKASRLREELASAVGERDELRYVICPNIETAYMLAIGSLEYRTFELRCRMLRLRRKAELIQTMINRQEPIDEAKIDAILNGEFAEYQMRLNSLLGSMNAALDRSRLELLSDAESAELKKLYRAIIKAIHPDLHPDFTSETLRLFENAASAYAAGDLAALRVIAELVAGGLSMDGPIGADVIERLSAMIAAVRRDIDEIKGRYPYTMKVVIEDPARTEDLRAELESEAARLTELMARHERRIAEMLRGSRSDGEGLKDER